MYAGPRGLGSGGRGHGGRGRRTLVPAHRSGAARRPAARRAKPA